LVCEDGKAYAAYVYEALYDSNSAQKESLLSVHQSLRSPRNGIDDRARCEHDVHGKPGLQRARFGSTVLPFFFDGTKCFFEVQCISEEELLILPKVTLTDGDVPYEPMDRLHSRRRLAVPEETLRNWKRCLGFVPDHVVTKALAVTSQLVPTVEAETRELMRDHFMTRLPELKVRRVNDTCFVDTFFSSIPSVRGYTCFNLYAYTTVSGTDNTATGSHGMWRACGYEVGQCSRIQGAAMDDLSEVYVDCIWVHRSSSSERKPCRTARRCNQSCDCSFADSDGVPDIILVLCIGIRVFGSNSAC
jgi:hypothetical protein